MEYELMDAFNKVQEDFISEGMPEEQAEALIKKVIWNLICRI
jgi:hypothetical protein